MSSSFLDIYGYKNRVKKIKALKDINAGRSYNYYKQKYINATKFPDDEDFKRRYITNNYLNFVLCEFLSFVPPETMVLKDDGEPLTTEEQKRLDDFFQSNSVDWNSIWNSLISDHKLCGDSFASYSVEKDSESSNGDEVKRISMLMLPSEDVEIFRDATGKILGYLYSVEVNYYDPEELKASPLEAEEKTKKVKYWFTNGFIEIYEEDTLVDTIENFEPLAESIQIVHYSGMREQGTPYSKIPYEKIVDQVLNLDSIDTDINYINKVTGSPTILTVDCEIDLENSMTGPGGIIYFNSITKNIDYKVTGQVSQLEVTNGLESYLMQRNTVLNVLYEKANLFPPSMIESVLRTDSSKVVSMLKKNLYSEILMAYTKMSDITKEIISLIASDFAVATGYRLKKKTMSDIEATMDQYIIQAYKMKLGELSKKDNLIEKGFTDDQIKKTSDEIAEEQQTLATQENETKKTEEVADIPLDNNTV